MTWPELLYKLWQDAQQSAWWVVPLAIVLAFLWRWMGTRKKD